PARINDPEYNRIPARPVRAAAALQLSVSAQFPGRAKRVIKKGELGFSFAAETVVSCQALAIDENGAVHGPREAVFRVLDSATMEAEAAFDELPAGPGKVVFLPRLRIPPKEMGNPWYNPRRQVELTREYLKGIRFGAGFRGFAELGINNERGIY